MRILSVQQKYTLIFTRNVAESSPPLPYPRSPRLFYPTDAPLCSIRVHEVPHTPAPARYRSLTNTEHNCPAATPVQIRLFTGVLIVVD